MWSLFLSPFGYLAEKVHKIKCKSRHGHKKFEKCRTKYIDCECCLKYTNVKDDLMVFKRLCCNRNYPKSFDEDLKKWFANTYAFLEPWYQYIYLAVVKRYLPIYIASRDLSTFIWDTLFGQSLEISPKNLMFWKIFNSEILIYWGMVYLSKF